MKTALSTLRSRVETSAIKSRSVPLEVCGEVCAGRGIAAGDIGRHITELKRLTGEELFVGTLNVILSRPLLLSRATAIRFDNGSRLLWPATIDGMRVWLYRWKHAPLHAVELLARVRLREALSLDEGDLIVLHIDRTIIAGVPLLGRLIWYLCWFGRRKWCYTKDRYYFASRKLCTLLGATQKPPFYRRNCES